MRVETDFVSVKLPVPPSVNVAFASRHGSAALTKTAQYRFWEQQVQDAHGYGEMLGTLSAGDYGLWISLSKELRGDIDNRIKLLSDIIKTPKYGQCGLGIVKDDKFMTAVYVEKIGGMARDECMISAVRAHTWGSYILMRLEL